MEEAAQPERLRPAAVRAARASSGALFAARLRSFQSQDAARFGFAGFALYVVAGGSAALVSGAFDGDGRAALALVNDARARLEVLRRLPADAPDARPEPEGRVGPNPVRYDGRFAVRRVPEERR